MKNNDKHNNINFSSPNIVDNFLGTSLSQKYNLPESKDKIIKIIKNTNITINNNILSSYYDDMYDLNPGIRLIDSEKRYRVDIVYGVLYDYNIDDINFFIKKSNGIGVLGIDPVYRSVVDKIFEKFKIIFPESDDLNEWIPSPKSLNQILIKIKNIAPK